MLDQDLKEQLKSVFAGLGQSIELVIDRSEHVQAAELS